jgi:hypothetical protein
LASARGQLGQRLLLCRLLAISQQVRLGHRHALVWEWQRAHCVVYGPGSEGSGGRKEFRDRSKQAIMTIGHNQIDLGCPSHAHILQEAQPSLLAFLRTGSQCQHLFVTCQIHAQGREDDRRIGLVPVTNTEMHPIEV